MYHPEGQERIVGNKWGMNGEKKEKIRELWILLTHRICSTALLPAAMSSPDSLTS